MKEYQVLADHVESELLELIDEVVKHITEKGYSDKPYFISRRISGEPLQVQICISPEES